MSTPVIQIESPPRDSRPVTYPTSSPSPRIAWIDYAKGIGIFLVVLGHVLRGLTSAGLQRPSGWTSFLDSWIYSFHMPLFFVLSGMFAERWVSKPTKEFLWNRVTAIVYPYLLWSVLQTIIQAGAGSQTNRQVDLRDLSEILIHPIMQFWFLYALFWISVLHYALRRVGLNPLPVFVAFVGLWLHRMASPQALAAISFGFVEGFGIYYALGALVSRTEWSARLQRAPGTQLGVLAAAGFAVVTAAMWMFDDRPTPFALIPVVAVVGVAASAGLSALASRFPHFGFVRRMGEYSLEIYLAHTIVSAAVRIVLARGLKISSIPIHLIAGTVAGIVVPIALVWMCQRIGATWLFRFPVSRTTPNPRTS